MYDLQDQVAVVTGGGGGIGAAVCQMLGESGAAVYVADVSAEAAAATAGLLDSAGHALPMDVTSYESCAEGLGEVVLEAGKIDILITCAGWSETHPFLGEDLDYWRKVVDINYYGTVYPCHVALGHMSDAGYGRIVTVSSDAGRVGTLGETVYAGAKAGVMGFTKSLAREAGRAGVTANCVSPGVTDTPLMRHQDQKVIDKMVRLVTLKRLGLPTEIAAGIVFLASPEASFITGQVLSVSGGLTMVG